MKRTIALFLSALLLVGSLIGCQKREETSFEALVRARTIEPIYEGGNGSTSLWQLLEKCAAKDEAISIVTGEVADVRYFMTWDERGCGGYSVAEMEKAYGLRVPYEMTILCGDLVELAHGRTLEEIR